MAYWIHLVVLIVQSFTNADGVFYVSEEKVSSKKAASSCNLGTPDIHFRKYWNTVSLEGADLDIDDGESVWSGYVQTYAAFLYEGCCEEQFAGSSANHTSMNMDPGECYSKCKTDVIGIQATTCHCNPRPTEKNTHATGCNSLCSNPSDTVCGGNETLSLYRKVQYHGSGGGATEEVGNCRAFDWTENGHHFYTWRQCSTKYPFLCAIDESSSIKFWYRLTWGRWRSTAWLCLQNKTKPAVELSYGYPDLNFNRNQTFWIGQIRSRVIGNNTESNCQAPGWRRGVITKEGGEHWLVFHSNPTALKSLCDNGK